MYSYVVDDNLLPFSVAIQCLQTVFGIDPDDSSQMEVVSGQPNLKV